MPSFTTSDGTSDDVIMAETDCVSDMDGSEDHDGDSGGYALTNNIRLKCDLECDVMCITNTMILSYPANTARKRCVGWRGKYN